MSGWRPEEMIENTGRIEFWRMTPIRQRLNVELPDWSSSFFCLVGLGTRNDGGTGPPATAYYIVLRGVQRLLKANVVAAELT
jgi:hypothetical protein